MAIKNIFIFSILFLNYANSFSQGLDLCLAASGLVSNMKNDEQQGDILSHRIKAGYGFKVAGKIKVNNRIKTGISIGYIKLGDVRLINAGYTQNNTEIFGTYEPWNIVKYKDYVKLNYYSFSFICSYSIYDKFEFGINLNNLFLSSNRLKRLIYVSNFKANYAETIWYSNKTSDVKKYNFAPEIFINMDLGKKTMIQLSYLNSLSSVFGNSSVFHHSFMLTLHLSLK